MERDPSLVEKARSAASALPGLASPAQHLVDHGLPVRSARKAYGGRVTIAEALRAPIREVPISSLRAVQNGVALKRVIEHIEDGGKVGHEQGDPSTGYPRDLPIVVELPSGKRYLHDGHHRVVATKLLGSSVVRARVVRIEPAVLKRWAAY